MRPGPDSAAALRQAVALHKAGRLDQAIKAYRALLKRWPALPQAHNNLGVALKASGRLQPALKAYRQALALAPDYAAAHGNLGSGLLLQGDAKAALPHFLAANRQEPGNAGHRQGLAAALRPMRFDTPSAAIEQGLLACFADPGIEHQALVPAALSLLRADPGLAPVLGDGASEPEGGPLAGLADRPLAMRLLLQTVIPDPAIEARLAALRRQCLAAVAEDSGSSALPVSRSLAAALAVQAFLTDYAYPLGEAESAWIDAIADRAAGESLKAGAIGDALIVAAQYRPLHGLPDADRLAGLAPPDSGPPNNDTLAALWRLQLTQPRAERALAEDLPRLTPIEDPTSAAVAAQYDEHPYPRWFATQAKSPRPLQAVLSELFPGREIAVPTAKPLQVLIAGCGTGKHAIDVATRYAGAEVLAVDLSRGALAVGQERARARGLDDLTFAQADILELGALDRRFHLIESVGVLHHLRDPLAGWRVLVDRLESPGLMRLGFYSRHARTAIEAARTWVAAGGYPATEAGLRAARQALLALDPSNPERKVTAQLDFYSLSGCRDLLFNVQERSYDLPELAAAISDLGLTFLGFEFADPALPRAYAARFPEDTAMTDLSNWDRFERENPDSFQQMYQFWCARV